MGWFQGKQEQPISQFLTQVVLEHSLVGLYKNSAYRIQKQQTLANIPHILRNPHRMFNCCIKFKFNFQTL